MFRPTGVLTTVAVSRGHSHKRDTPVCVCLCVCMCGEEKRGSSVDCLTVFGNIFFRFAKIYSTLENLQSERLGFLYSEKNNIFRGIFKIIHPYPMEKVWDYLQQLILPTQFHFFHDSYLHDSM